jgi:hypothetical protein
MWAKNILQSELERGLQRGFVAYKQSIAQDLKEEERLLFGHVAEKDRGGISHLFSRRRKAEVRSHQDRSNDEVHGLTIYKGVRIHISFTYPSSRLQKGRTDIQALDS